MQGQGAIVSDVHFPAFSKRAARRMIQRAFVLAGRNREVRQHLRTADAKMLWVLEDWGLAWTVVLNRGKVLYERRPTKQPDATLTWATAVQFFQDVETGTLRVEGSEFAPSPALRKLAEPVYQAFCSSLRTLLRNPVDDQGESLL